MFTVPISMTDHACSGIKHCDAAATVTVHRILVLLICGSTLGLVAARSGAQTLPRTAEECASMGGDRSTFQECNDATYCCGVCNDVSDCTLPSGVALHACACKNVTCDHSVHRVLPLRSSKNLDPNMSYVRGVRVVSNRWSKNRMQIKHKTFEDITGDAVLYAVVGGVLMHNKNHVRKIHANDDGLYTGRIVPFEDMAQHAISRLPYCVPDVVFFVSFRDECPCGTPVLCYGITENCDAFLMPSYTSWMDARWTEQEYIERTHCYDSRYPFSEKIERAVWRGSTTGYTNPPLTPTSNAWLDLPRLKLDLLGRAYPNELDTAIVRVVQFNEDHTAAISRLLHHSSPKQLHSEDYMRYRAIIDVDGNSWSSRFLGLLCTNSIVVKQRSRYKEFFSDSIKPGYHYVEVEPDLSNLVHRIRNVLRMAKTEQGRLQLRKMVDAANQFCRETLTKDVLATALLDTWVTMANHSEPHVDPLSIVRTHKLMAVREHAPAGHPCS